MAITSSYNAMRRGLLGLHADRKGGDRLVKWYEGPEAGMMALPRDRPLPPGLRRLVVRNDGRYYYHDEISAYAASSELDSLRQ